VLSKDLEHSHLAFDLFLEVVCSALFFCLLSVWFLLWFWFLRQMLTEVIHLSRWEWNVLIRVRSESNRVKNGLGLKIKRHSRFLYHHFLPFISPAPQSSFIVKFASSKCHLNSTALFGHFLPPLIFLLAHLGAIL